MKEPNDIVLKKGDRVYFEDGTKRLIEDEYLWTLEDPTVTKIERPVKYKTIYEAPKQILNQKEKEYLEAVLRPFRHKVINIMKRDVFDEECICIETEDQNGFILPRFKRDTMYKGMETTKKYTLDELGLFEGE